MVQPSDDYAVSGSGGSQTSGGLRGSVASDYIAGSSGSKYQGGDGANWGAGGGGDSLMTSQFILGLFRNKFISCSSCNY